MIATADLPRDIASAILTGDLDKLHELAPCECCCDEHTFDHCAARIWHGCRGQTTMTHEEDLAWARHYERYHGMTQEQFFS